MSGVKNIYPGDRCYLQKYAYILGFCFLVCAVSAQAEDKIDQRMGSTPLVGEDYEPKPETWRSQLEGALVPEVLDTPLAKFKALLDDSFHATVKGIPVNAGISGRLTPAFRYGDNSQDTDFSLLDNNNSATEVVGVVEAGLDKEWVLGGRLKLPLIFVSSVSADFDDSNANLFSGLGEREILAYIEQSKYGKLSLGYGGTATNESSEVDMSGTIVISRSRVRDLAGGLSFENDGPQISSVFANYDGLGDDYRVRYDTAKISDFTVSTSFTVDKDADIAVNWQPTLKDRRFSVTGGLARWDSGVEQLSLSASLLLDTGLNFTAAIAGQDQDDRNPFFMYGKVGWISRPFHWGPTALAVDATINRDTLEDGDKSFSTGVFAVQTLEKKGIVRGIDFYLGVRLHHYEGKDEDFDDIFATMTGIRIRF
jgi:hypothetical protein